jgi:hypothetical protein
MYSGITDKFTPDTLGDIPFEGHIIRLHGGQIDAE